MKISESLIGTLTPVEGIVSIVQEKFLNDSELYLEELYVYVSDFHHHIENFLDNDEGNRFKDFYEREVFELSNVIKVVNLNMATAETHVPSTSELKKCSANRGVVIQYLMSLNSIAQKEIAELS